MPDEEKNQVSDTPRNPIMRFFAQPADSIGKTIFVAVSVCLVASMIVSAAAVVLKPMQEANKKLDKYVNVLQVAGLYKEGADVEKAFTAFEPRILELETGKFVDQFDVKTFDDRAVGVVGQSRIADRQQSAGAHFLLQPLGDGERGEDR